jgi:hypothetical protein
MLSTCSSGCVLVAGRRLPAAGRHGACLREMWKTNRGGDRTSLTWVVPHTFLSIQGQLGHFLLRDLCVIVFLVMFHEKSLSCHVADFIKE